MGCLICQKSRPLVVPSQDPSQKLNMLVFGEQVAKRAGISWLAGVQADLERAGYTFGAANLPAAGVGAPHIRERLYWGAARMGSPIRARLEGLRTSIRGRSDYCRRGLKATSSGGSGGGFPVRISHPDSGRFRGAELLLRPGGPRQENPDAARGGRVGELVRLPDPERDGLRISGGPTTIEPDEYNHGSVRGFWSRYDVAHFADGKARRIEPGTFPLVDGVPRGVGYSGDPLLPEYVNATSEARVTRLKGYGNAIVPQVAAVFVKSFFGAVCDLIWDDSLGESDHGRVRDGVVTVKKTGKKC